MNKQNQYEVLTTQALEAQRLRDEGAADMAACRERRALKTGGLEE